MASPDAFDAIETYLKDQIIQQSILPIELLVFENEDFPTPVQPTLWAFAEVWSSIFDQASLGAGEPKDNLWREFGFVYVHVMAPRGSGSRAARTMARKFADLFRGLQLAGLTFAQCSIGAGEPGIEDGSYWRMTMTAEWRRDEQGST